MPRSFRKVLLLLVVWPCLVVTAFAIESYTELDWTQSAWSVGILGLAATVVTLLSKGGTGPRIEVSDVRLDGKDLNKTMTVSFVNYGDEPDVLRSLDVESFGRGSTNTVATTTGTPHVIVGLKQPIEDLPHELSARRRVTCQFWIIVGDPEPVHRALESSTEPWEIKVRARFRHHRDIQLRWKGLGWTAHRVLPSPLAWLPFKGKKVGASS